VDALTRTQETSYDLIISDYAGSSSPQLTAAARARGAIDYLNDPAALVRLATTTILGTRP